MSVRDDEVKKILKRARDAQFVIDPENPDRCIENPRRLEAAAEALWELEQLLEREPHRPTDVAGAFRDRLRRAVCAELLYKGLLPSKDVPRGHEDDARLAFDNRTKADKLAAKITNSSARQVQRARRQSLTKSGAWELASEPGHRVELDEAGLLQIWQASKSAKK